MKRIKLDELNKTLPYQVPDGYFDGLADKIQHKVEAKGNQRKLRPWSLISIAASVALVAVAGLSWLLNDEKLTPEQLLAQVSDQDVMLYLQTTDISEAELLAWLPDDVDTPLESLSLDGTDIDELIDQYGFEID
jgi:hypothetical protein